MVVRTNHRVFHRSRQCTFAAGMHSLYQLRLLMSTDLVSLHAKDPLQAFLVQVQDVVLLDLQNSSFRWFERQNFYRNGVKSDVSFDVARLPPRRWKVRRKLVGGVSLGRPSLTFFLREILLSPLL